MPYKCPSGNSTLSGRWSTGRLSSGERKHQPFFKNTSAGPDAVKTPASCWQSYCLNDGLDLDSALHLSHYLSALFLLATVSYNHKHGCQSAAKSSPSLKAMSVKCLAQGHSARDWDEAELEPPNFSATGQTALPLQSPPTQTATRLVSRLKLKAGVHQIGARKKLLHIHSGSHSKNSTHFIAFLFHIIYASDVSTKLWPVYR